MKNIILTLGLTVMLTGCGLVDPPHDNLVNINAEFQPYVNRFLSYSRSFGGPNAIHDLVIVIDESMPGPTGSDSWTLAVCRSGGNTTPEIRVNANFWKNPYYSNSDREELLFHELGHCVLGRGHSNEKVVSQDNYNLPASIMYPYHLGATIYGRNYN